MACCLTAPSHYLNQCWLITLRSCGMHLMTLSQEDLKIPISKARLKITFIKITLRSPRGQWVKENSFKTLPASVKSNRGDQSRAYYPGGSYRTYNPGAPSLSQVIAFIWKSDTRVHSSTSVPSSDVFQRFGYLTGHQWPLLLRKLTRG